jgi:hypothetical protein
LIIEQSVKDFVVMILAVNYACIQLDPIFKSISVSEIMEGCAVSPIQCSTEMMPADHVLKFESTAGSIFFCSTHTSALLNENTSPVRIDLAIKYGLR